MTMSLPLPALHFLPMVKFSQALREEKHSRSIRRLPRHVQNHRRVLQVHGANSAKVTNFAFFDALGNPTMADWSYIDDDG